MKITRTLLEENQACISQKEIFIAEFPEGMDLTRENLEKCITLKLPIEWLPRLLPIERLKIFKVPYEAARATRDVTCTTAFETYEVTCATSRATYDAIREAALVTFRSAIIDPLLEAFKEET